jgi:hypothetical protein
MRCVRLVKVMCAAVHILWVTHISRISQHAADTVKQRTGQLQYLVVMLLLHEAVDDVKSGHVFKAAAKCCAGRGHAVPIGGGGGYSCVFELLPQALIEVKTLRYVVKIM